MLSSYFVKKKERKVNEYNHMHTHMRQFLTNWHPELTKVAELYSSILSKFDNMIQQLNQIIFISSSGHSFV